MACRVIITSVTAPPAADGVPFARGSTSTVQEDGSGSVLKSLHRERKVQKTWEGLGTKGPHIKVFVCLIPGGCCGNWGELGT